MIRRLFLTGILFFALSACGVGRINESEPLPVSSTPTLSVKDTPASTDVPIQTVVPTEVLAFPTYTATPVFSPTLFTTLKPPKDFEFEYGGDSFAWSPDGKNLVVGGSAGGITIWDVGSSEPIHSMWIHKHLISSIAYSPNGELIASGDQEGNLFIWRSDGNLVTQFNIPKTSDVMVSIDVLLWNPDSSRLYGLVSDKTIHVWDTKDFKEVAVWMSFDYPMDISLSSDGQYLAVGEYDGYIEILDPKSGSVVDRMQISEEPINKVAYSPSDALFIVHTMDGTMWATYSPTHQGAWIRDDEGGGGIYAFTWSPDGRYIAAGSLLDNVTIWDTREGDPVITMDGSATSAISWSPDGRFLAISSSGDVEIWSVFLP